jgi:hypothetical protein
MMVNQMKERHLLRETLRWAWLTGLWGICWMVLLHLIK